MEITGKLIQLLPDVSGESARGPWVKGGFVIETEGDYPRKVAFVTCGEENFNPESREFNERWYTDLRASRIQPFVPGQMPPAAGGYNWAGAPTPAAAQGAAPAAPAQQAAPAAQPANFAAAPQMASTDDDLPF